MDANFYRNYKRKFLIGLGVLLALTCLALAKYNVLLGVVGFFTVLAGLYAFSYVDKQEQAIREREIREELLSMEMDELPVESPTTDIALVFLQVDDYDEVFQELTDEQRPLLVIAVDKCLREWAAETNAYLRKDGRDRYTALLPVEELESQENQEFPILDRVREIKVGNHIPVTLSIGAAKRVKAEEPAQLGQLAQQALELSLERGGDQAVVKSADHTWFYGGHTEVVGKRNKVRVRVTAVELSRLIQHANNVVIMGHSQMDFDVLGAALGCAEIVRHYGKKVWILTDQPCGAVDKLVALINDRDPGLICEKGTLGVEVSSQTLLLLVDVHRPQMVVDPSLLSRAGYIAVLDHHRRGEEFLERCNLSYIMPGASSTSELVGELVDYLPEDIRFSPLAATALMTGIIVDTKRFIFSTSARTFRIAAQLREAGADQMLIRELFTDSLQVMLYRARILQNVELVFGRFAVAGHDETMDGAHVAASRAADTLLEIAGVDASFTFYPIADGIGVSARSTGSVNVHRIMEKMGGGGHFSVAAAQLRGVTMEDARSRLLEILKEEQEEE
ncbi:MAG: DHH family phosphoesterase [Syntrophaceticus sp.]